MTLLCEAKIKNKVEIRGIIIYSSCSLIITSEPLTNKQKQTAGTAYFSSKYLPLFVIAL